MKTTMTIRSIANPRRITLAHLDDAAELERGARPDHSEDLPTATANPRRTTLMDAPVTAAH
ncbi:hypothetical protein [Streptomyces sp. NPDC047928]|uniref:hypothetical protein n=1 Tax=unclassified Streptomyces TaxID=2593676 RepID=UPI00371192C1